MNYSLEKDFILDNQSGINELYEREKRNDEGEPKNDDTEEIKISDHMESFR